ncbi:MAG TPA: glycine zipper 2TM domain-containing protein [Burkholderiales bacterium]|nr:glycine zipper 2TM domain-containing protein [Burkholderiales bacterium]
MKRFTNVVILAAAVALGGCANAPIQKTRQHCDPHYGAAIVGALAGGALGAQIGGGSGRIAATALGAGAGALAGSQLDCYR